LLCSDCSISTDRASRFLVQLCRHARFMVGIDHRLVGDGAHRPPRVLEVRYSTDEGIIRFDGGTCVLTAPTGFLRLRIDASDAPTLDRLQAGMTNRMKTVARRDGLLPVWSNPVESVQESETAHDGVRARSRALQWPLVIAVVAVVVAVHLTAATMVRGAASVGWAALAGLLVAAVAVIAGHAFIGRAVFRTAGRAHVRRQGRPHASPSHCVASGPGEDAQR
jgi:hypothetical protein